VANPTDIELLQDPLLMLVGSGKELWADEYADKYVRRLREGRELAVDARPGTPANSEELTP
jgi:hypothetical protein